MSTTSTDILGRRETTADQAAVLEHKRGNGWSGSQGRIRLGSDPERLERVVSSMSPATEASVRKVLDGIEDPELASRYPKRTHLIPADNPKSGTMVTRALFGGDPAVLVYPDGREILFTPERASGLLAIVLLIGCALIWVRSRRGKDAEVIQFPPRTRIEARDSRGISLAA